MKLGVVFVIALACKLASCEVYYDQSGYGYGVNPKPSGSSDDETLSSVNVATKEPINSQESKPKAYLVRLKPKDDLESSAIPNKKSKFLLLLRLPEDHEETQATSLTSEVQQKDESGYQQSDIPTQDNFSSLIQTPYSSFENQKDESGQYQQQSEPQQYQQQSQYQQQQQQEEAVIPQQNDSGYLQPLQTDGYGQSQSNEQAQQKDETYSQQQPQPQPQQQQQQQQQQQYDAAEDFDKQAKDDSGYQQQSYSQQQDSGYGSVSTSFPSQSQTSAFKNGFSPLPNYDHPQVQQQMPAVDSVKGVRNNFFRAPVLQDTQKITNTYGSNDFQSRETESFGGPLEQVKSPAIKSQPASQSTYGLNSGTKTSTYSEANRDSTKGSFQPSFYPSSDSSRKSATPTIHSSYPSQQSPMKSPAQVYAQQQQQQQQQQKQQQDIEPARKTITSPVKDFYGQSAQPESNSYGSQQGFSSEYGSNEESIKSASPVKDSSSYGIKQEGIKTPPKQSYENVQSSPIVNDYSNTFNNPQSFSQAPISSSFAPSFGYGVQQQLQDQPQQQAKQDDYNQAGQNNEDLQEKDEQSDYSPEQQENEEPEKKMPVLLVPGPPESSPYAPSDNQKKENFDSQQQQSYDSQQKSESDFQQSSGSLGNDESNYNAPVKGQAPISNYEQSTQSVQADSYGQQPSSVGQKSPSLRFPTKSSIKTQQPIQPSSGYTSGVSSSSVKGGRAPQQSNYNNDYSSGFQAAPKDTKSVKPSPSLDSSYSSATKGGQTSDEGFSNEQKTSVKGSNQPTKSNAVQSSYSAALQPPVKAARAFQQSAGYSSEVKSTKGISESYSKPSQSPVESHFNDYQATPVQQQSQPEQPEQQKQTQADLGYNLRAPTKGGRAQSQQSNTDSYSSNSQSSFNSDYQPSSVKGGAISQQQNSYPIGFSSAFSSSPAQQTSGYGSSFYQSLPGGVKGSQNSQIQQQQSDAESLPNQSSQPAFASFSASVKGSAPVAPQIQQNFDDGYSSGFQAPIASSAPVQQTQSDRGYSSVPQSSGIKGGQQVSSSYEQSPLPNVSGTKSSLNQPKAPLAIPNYRTKAGRSQLSSTKSSKTAPPNQKSPISSYPSFPISQQTQPEQQQDTKSSVKPQSNTKSALKNPSTSYLPALSPPSATKSTYAAPPQSKSPQQDSSYFPLPVNSQQQLQSPKNAPLTRGLPPPPALVARSRPAQSFNFPSSQSQVQPSSESYPSYSASSNTPVFDDEEDAMSITADDMGAYGLRTNSPYDATAASATSHLRAVEQPQGSGRVVLLLFNKEHAHSQAPRMSLSPDSRGIY